MAVQCNTDVGWLRWHIMKDTKSCLCTYEQYMYERKNTQKHELSYFRVSVYTVYYIKTQRLPYCSYFNKNKSHTCSVIMTPSPHPCGILMCCSLPSFTLVVAWYYFQGYSLVYTWMIPYNEDGNTVCLRQKVQVEKVIMEGRKEGDELRKYREQRGWGGVGKK